MSLANTTIDYFKGIHNLCLVFSGEATKLEFRYLGPTLTHSSWDHVTQLYKKKDYWDYLLRNLISSIYKGHYPLDLLFPLILASTWKADVSLLKQQPSLNFQTTSGRPCLHMLRITEEKE